MVTEEDHNRASAPAEYEQSNWNWTGKETKPHRSLLLSFYVDVDLVSERRGPQTLRASASRNDCV